MDENCTSEAAVQPPPREIIQEYHALRYNLVLPAFRHERLLESGIRSGCIVSCGFEVVGAFAWCEGSDEAAHDGPEAIDGALGGLAQEGLQLGEGVFDRVEVGAVRRQIQKARADRFDHGAHLGSFVAGEVVHDDDIAWLERRDEDAGDVGLEGVAIDRSVEDEGSNHSVGRETSHERGRLRVSVSDADPQALSARRSSVTARHVGGGPCLVDEDEPRGIEVELAVEPCLPTPQDVGSVLLARMRSRFFARDRMPLEEALDRAEAEGVPLVGENVAKFLDRHIGRRAEHSQDQILAGLDPAGAPIAAERLRPGVALRLLAPPPSADARRADAKPLAGLSVRHPVGDRCQNAGSQIKRKGSRHACRPPPRQTA